MIIEIIFGWVSNLIVGLFSGLEFIHLPIDFIATLYNILCYGVWVVGADIMALFTSAVMFWFTLKSSVGFAVWLWKLLPLT